LFPLPLYSTGADLAEGDDDPHWQIVASLTDPSFVSQPAIVASPAPNYMPNDPREAQWVSLTENRSDVEANARFTFRTTFDLNGFDPRSASVRGSFSVDNQVTAIRVNGVEIPVPEHPGEMFWKMFSFSVEPDLLEAGRNHLELDIFNGVEGVVRNNPSAIALRVLLEGMGEKIE